MTEEKGRKTDEESERTISVTRIWFAREEREEMWEEGRDEGRDEEEK